MSPDQSDRLLDFIAWSYVPSNKEINKEIINFPTYTDNEASRFTTRSSKDGIVLTRIGDRMHMHLETFLCGGDLNGIQEERASLHVLPRAAHKSPRDPKLRLQ